MHTSVKRIDVFVVWSH